MADTEYTIYFKGEALDGFDINTAKKNFAALFKIPNSKVEPFFCNKTRALKKGLTQEKTKQLIQTLNKAGLKVYIKKDASLNDEKDQSKKDLNKGGLSMLPLGADVLTPEERPADEKISIDISHIQLSSSTEPLSGAKATHSPLTPDTSHLEATGHYNALDNGNPEAAIIPNTEHLSLIDADHCL